MKNFDEKKFSETPKCSPMKYFGTVRQKLFDGKSWYLPPLLSIKIFSLPEIFRNTEWFPGEVFSVLWDKKIFGKTVKVPPSFAWKFSIPEFFRNTEVFSYEFYRHCETKIFQRSFVISPSYALHEIFWNTELFPNEIFRYCVTKVFDGETWYPPPSDA